MDATLDVLIIGGGPAGSTTGTLLRKYNPSLNVAIIEREVFPREHVGESQLPRISQILAEMGVWEKVEAAGFPIKIGATYRWGNDDRLWDFEFIPSEKFVEEARPAPLKGQRTKTAFQVDRAIYDKILLDHAEEMGCSVRQGIRVTDVQVEGQTIRSVTLDDGSVVRAKHYVDASGGAAILRRAVGVDTECPTTLQNVAFWDYWENAEWAVEIGVGGTRVQVLSLGWGWIWFIPMGPTRTSIGLVVPATTYRESGMRPAELYAKALAEEPRIRDLIRNAKAEGHVRGTKDWSFVSKQMVGPNWFLAGESAGFADPILAAGMTLAHVGAMECAYTILELERGELEADWLRERYAETQEVRIRQHIRFADFWYSANGCFTDLKEYTREIAKDAGFDLDADRAFQWLGTGGFLNDKFGVAGIGEYSLDAVKGISGFFTDQVPTWEINKYNVFRLNLLGATQDTLPLFRDGRIERHPCYVRKGKRLPNSGLMRLLLATLAQERAMARIFEMLRTRLIQAGMEKQAPEALRECSFLLEVLILEGWVKGEVDKKAPFLSIRGALDLEEGTAIHYNRDAERLTTA